MGKIIFLDIDGTLVDFHMRMPESSKKALVLARENGHKIALCTGRTYTNIYPWLLDFGFDGVVASAGAYIRAEEKVIFHNTLIKEQTKRLTSLLKCHHAGYMLQGIEGRFADYENTRLMEEHFKALGLDTKRVMSQMTVVDQPAEQPCLESGMYFRADINIEEMQKEIDEKLDGYFRITGASFGPDREYCGEMTCKAVNKATGMNCLMDYFGMNHFDSIGIGDGPNDFEMIEFAGTGIVMGNGMEALKKRADYVTTAINEDGIYEAFKHFGLFK